jgi:quercetin dioxygenase-like cupin family protein
MAHVHPERVPRPEWSPLPHAGCVNVEGKVLLHSGSLLIAMLRFSSVATIHEHDAAWNIDVICLEGSGFVSVDGVTSSFTAGERIRWPSGSMHRLWTEATTMTTLMVEHVPAATP